MLLTVGLIVLYLIIQNPTDKLLWGIALVGLLETIMEIANGIPDEHS